MKQVWDDLDRPKNVLHQVLHLWILQSPTFLPRKRQCRQSSDTSGFHGLCARGSDGETRLIGSSALHQTGSSLSSTQSADHVQPAPDPTFGCDFTQPTGKIKSPPKMGANRGPATSAVTIMITVLSTVFVGARFFTRLYVVRIVRREDWWMFAAWLVAVGFSISICVGVHYGLGLHSVDIRPQSNHVPLRKAEYGFSVLYNPSLMLTKTSIIVFYLSVMSRDIDPIFKWASWLTLAVTNVFGAALTFLNIFQCTPVGSTFIYPTPSNAKCTDIVTLFLSSAPLNIITDLAILFLPMPILTGMRLPKKQKLILIVTFGFGAFVPIVDVIRIAYLQNASLNRLKVVHGHLGGGARQQEQNDFSWFASLSFMWSAVEVHLGIICACVPSLKPLFLRFLPKFIRSAGDEMSTKGSIGSVEHSSNGNGDAPRAKTNLSMLNNPAAFRKPVVEEYTGDDTGDAMGFLNMLSSPAPEVSETKRAPARFTRAPRRKKTTTTDFGFVHMDKTKNMLKLSNAQSLWPIGVVTIIFFLWGFAYGLLDTLNAKFQEVAHVGKNQSLGLHASYYSGYLVGPLTLGQFILRRYGFKAAMMAGLCVYGCGTLVFWPSAVLTSYPAFVVSNFIVAFGLSCLEIAANPYIALCGPLEYAEARLNFSQAFQAIGTILSPLLATKVLFPNNKASALVNVQWAYLAIAFFVIALAIVFYYIPLPEATDEQLEALADRRSAVYRTKVGPYRVIYVTLALGVFSQWCYVGGQESIGDSTQILYTYFRPHAKLTAFDYQTVSHTVFMAGRFLSAVLNYIFKPRWILLILYSGLIVCCALQMAVNGTGALVVNQLIYLFESGIFSIIFAISLRGMGDKTKVATTLMTAAISGGALFTVLQWATQNHHTLKFSFIVPLIVYAFGWIFPVYLNLVPAARKQVDPVHEHRRLRREARASRPKPTRNESEVSKMSNPDSSTQRFGLLGIMARRKKAKEQKAQDGEITFDADDGSIRGPGGMSSPLSPSSPKEGTEERFEYFSLGPPERVADPPTVQMRRPSGIVGDLEVWPVHTAASPATSSAAHHDTSDSGHSAPQHQHGSVSGDSDDVIQRHRPTWMDGVEDDDAEADYHRYLRGI